MKFSGCFLGSVLLYLCVSTSVFASQGKRIGLGTCGTLEFPTTDPNCVCAQRTVFRINKTTVRGNTSHVCDQAASKAKTYCSRLGRVAAFKITRTSKYGREFLGIGSVTCKIHYTCTYTPLRMKKTQPVTKSFQKTVLGVVSNVRAAGHPRALFARAKYLATRDCTNKVQATRIVQIHVSRIAHSVGGGWTDSWRYTCTYQKTGIVQEGRYWCKEP